MSLMLTRDWEFVLAGLVDVLMATENMAVLGVAFIMHQTLCGHCGLRMLYPIKSGIVKQEDGVLCRIGDDMHCTSCRKQESNPNN